MTVFLPIGPKLDPQTTRPATPADARRHAAAMQAAQKLEATFLAEMLKAAGLGEQASSFSGGAGEDQFASFHRQALADRIAQAGGIGLSEHFLRSIMERQDE